MLFQPTNIMPDDVNGSGCVDALKNLKISWQINGDSPMTAYKITIYKNEAVPTSSYTTGKVTLSTPAWGRNYAGEITRYTVELSPNVINQSIPYANGGEYKFLITQWWDTDLSIQQLTASVFNTRETPSIAINEIPSPVTTKAYTFGATYVQSDGDPLNYIRWMVAQEGFENDPLLDTGIITGTGELQVEYDGFLTGITYQVRCIIQTINNIEADTGWVSFLVDYSTEEAEGTATACQLANTTAVFVSWTMVENAYGYSVMRRKVGETRLSKVVEVSNTVGQIRDYEATSGESYIYYVFPEGQVAFLSGPMITNQVDVKYWSWSIIEAQLTKEKMYTVLAVHQFKYGEGGIKEGSFSNNNSPNLLKNFTRYPTRQPTAQNYKTGSVSGYIGTVSKASGTYSDTVQQVDAIMELSTTENSLFLVDPKGHFLKIHTNGPITAQTDVNKAVMPQTVTIPWVEVGPTDGIMVTSSPENSFYPIDKIIFTTLYVDPTTAALVWNVPDDYDEGSQMLLQDGILIQDATGSFTPAVMNLDAETLIVTAEVQTEEGQ